MPALGGNQNHNLSVISYALNPCSSTTFQLILVHDENQVMAFCFISIYDDASQNPHHCVNNSAVLYITCLDADVGLPKQHQRCDKIQVSHFCVRHAQVHPHCKRLHLFCHPFHGAKNSDQVPCQEERSPVLAVLGCYLDGWALMEILELGDSPKPGWFIPQRSSTRRCIAFCFKSYWMLICQLIFPTILVSRVF